MEQPLAWGLILIGISVLLVVLEIFVPSGGVIAVVAGLAALGGIVSLFMHDMIWGVIGLAGVAIATPIAFFGGLKVWSSTRMGRKMLGEDAQAELQRLRDSEHRKREDLAALVGVEGVALTDLHPIGVIKVDGQRYDAQAEIRIVDAGERVVVTHADGFQIKVRRVEG